MVTSMNLAAINMDKFVGRVNLCVRMYFSHQTHTSLKTDPYQEKITIFSLKTHLEYATSLNKQ